MCWVGQDSLLHREVQCSPQSVQSPGGCFLFFQGFLRSSYQKISSCWSTVALGSDHGLLLGTGVQFVVFYTIVKAQVVFKILFILISGQLAIASQLGREDHLWKIWLFLRSRGQRWFGGCLGGWGCQRWICLILEDYSMTGGGSFSLLPGVRLKSLFLCLPCTMVFAVMFPVMVIDSHCQSVHILEQDGFFLFPGKDRILDLIWESMVITMAQHTISLT